MPSGAGALQQIKPCQNWGAQPLYMSYSLNSFKGGYIGDYIGDYFRGY